jgi:hypothetical protein
MYVHLDTWKELKQERKLLMSAWKGGFMACGYQSDDISWLTASCLSQEAPSPPPAAGAGARQARQEIYSGDSDLQPRRLEEDLEEARRDIIALQQDFIPACEARLLAAEEKHSFMSHSQEVPPVTPSMEGVEKDDAAMPAQHKTPTSNEYMIELVMSAAWSDTSLCTASRLDRLPAWRSAIGEPGLRGKDNPRRDAPD